MLIYSQSKTVASVVSCTVHKYGHKYTRKLNQKTTHFTPNINETVKLLIKLCIFSRHDTILNFVSALVGFVTVCTHYACYKHGATENMLSGYLWHVQWRMSMHQMMKTVFSMLHLWVWCDNIFFLFFFLCYCCVGWWNWITKLITYIRFCNIKICQTLKTLTLYARQLLLILCMDSSMFSHLKI